MALCDTQHAGKEIATRPMSEYFANDPECHDLLPCALRSHRVAGLGGCTPVGGVTSTSTPALWPCAVLWPCTFCSDRTLNNNGNLLFMYVVLLVKFLVFSASGFKYTTSTRTPRSRCRWSVWVRIPGRANAKEIS